MYSGMTRKEIQGLMVLLVIMVLGVGIRAYMRSQERPFSWVEVPADGSGPSSVQSQAAGSHGPPAIQLLQAPLDINTASAVDLQDSLPGIGPAKAADIIAHRNANGPFPNVDALDRVPGIGPKTLERLRPLVTVAPAAATPAPGPAVTPPRPILTQSAVTPAQAPARLNLNTASSGELQTLPGIGPVTAGKILRYREAHGPFRSVEEITEVSGIGPKTLESLRPIVTVGP